MLEALPSYTRVGKPAPNSSHFWVSGIIMEASRSLSCKEDIVVEVHQKTTILSRISCKGVVMEVRFKWFSEIQMGDGHSFSGGNISL